MSVSQSTQFSIEQCINNAQTYQKKLLNLFNNRRYASLQLVEALAYAEKPTKVVELSQEVPFQRTYSTINKILNAFGPGSLLEMAKKIKDCPEKTILNSQSDAFSKITKPFSDLFFEMLPEKELDQKYLVFGIDSTPNARIHAHTLDDRSYVYQANQIGTPVTIGFQVSALVYLRERTSKDASWQLPISLERISTETTACEVATTQLNLLAKAINNLLCVICVDSAYTSLEPQSEDQVVIARSRIDRQGQRPAKNDQCIQGRGRPRKYDPGIIRFSDDLPPGSENGSDEEITHEDIINGQQVYVLLNRWNDVYVDGHSELVDVVKVEIFSKDNCKNTMYPPLLLIVSGKRRREIMSLDALKCYLLRFGIEHFFRFMKQKLLFCEYQTPELDHQVSWWWFCCMTYWLLYHTRHIANGSTRPWHKKRAPDKPAGPGEVKRLFAKKIFPVLGSPSRPPIKREKSKGRELGTCFIKRKRKEVVKKSDLKQKAA